MVVLLNSGDWPEKMTPKILTCQKSTLTVAFMQKSAKMHWYNYNNIVPLLNIEKTWIFYPVYNFKLEYLKIEIFKKMSRDCNCYKK